MPTFFSEYFEIDAKIVEDYGAFNISLVNDLPLFIDPFLLFNSEKENYVELHNEIIRYLIFLKVRATSTPIDEGLLRAWYCFPEIKQNWLGFSVSGNSGSGLGIDFARALHSNLHRLFPDFGGETVTKGSHLEKVCLIADGVGRDHISDFTTNLISDFLCTYTQKFALDHLSEKHWREVPIERVKFNYITETWERGRFCLPYTNGDYVILTPKDILTRDENWINRRDMIESFELIPAAIPDADLRAQVSNYFHQALVRHKDREPSKSELGAAATATILRFPQLIDFYIRLKEQHGDEAMNVSSERVLATEQVFIHHLQELQKILSAETKFYSVGHTTYEEAHRRLAYLKDVIENKGGYRLFLSRQSTRSPRKGPARTVPLDLVRHSICSRNRGQ